MYIKQSVKKPSAPSPGASAPKDPNLTIVDVEDILQWPVRDGKGVKMQGNYVLAGGASMIQLYTTPSKTKPTWESEGDEDAISIKQKIEVEHPGDELEINEFIQNWMGKNVIVIYGSCIDPYRRVLGSRCAPLQLKPSSQDDNDGRKKMITFEQFAATNQVPGFYEGSLSFEEPKATGASVAVTEAGNYKVASSDTTTAIEIASVTAEHGSTIALIGSGGTEPSVLSPTANTDPIQVLLKNGANWTALTDAVINLEVFKAGATTYLIEVSRA